MIDAKDMVKRLRGLHSENAEEVADVIESLHERCLLLDSLLNNGVDNWSGWDSACEERDELLEKEND